MTQDLEEIYGTFQFEISEVAPDTAPGPKKRKKENHQETEGKECHDGERSRLEQIADLKLGDLFDKA